MKALRSLLRDMGVPRMRLALAVGWGSAALGSAVGLSAVASWLIARAAGMPSPADLGVAAVIVRFFGIGRGLFRYLERLASHETALRGVVDLRVKVYERMADAGTVQISALRRGDVMARVGKDVDTVGDAVVRGAIPLMVAAVVSTVSIAISAWLLPTAGIVMVLGVLVSGIGAAALTWRAAAVAARAGVKADAQVTIAALSAIESAPEHRVWGTSGEVADELERANRASEAAQEAAARPASLAAAIQTLAAGATLIGAVLLAVTAAYAGVLNPMETTVVALLPLAAFEAVGAVPTAVTQLFRSEQAARRIEELTAPADRREPVPAGESGVLELQGLQAAWPEMAPTRPVDVRLEAGQSLAIVGRSGIGKTTLLLTIAGLLDAHAGTVTYGGRPTRDLPDGHLVAMTAEDAHVFGTTVLENLRVARGSASPGEATAALGAVGLGDWLSSLPQGLDTPIGSGGGTVSGGERRRLLLARALVSDHPVHLIDEPAEHLDDAGRTALRAALAWMSRQGRTVIIVTHDLSFTTATTQAVTLDG